MVHNQYTHHIANNNQSQNENTDETQIPNGYSHEQVVTSAAGTNQSEVKIPNIFLHFCFDGTSNNKHNTKVRLDRLKEDNPTFDQDTILLASKEECDNFAQKESYRNFNISFKDLHKKCLSYKKYSKFKYFDILSRTEKALQNIDPPEKPKLTGHENVDRMKEAEFKYDSEPFEYVKQLLATNNEKFLNKYDDLSYYNYYSNIGLLSDAINISELKNHYVFYIGGAGTISFGKDDVSGAAYAHGESGVEDKVFQAVTELKNFLKRFNLYHTKNSALNNSASNNILVNINLYGFSRGAFYARNFYSQLKKLINSNDPDLIYFKGLIRFKLAIFLDTVTSEGIVHSNDVGEFDLDQDYDNMEVYHICAQDEFRYHFPLTSIPKCLKNNTNSIEITIPGSHSDIGGGYSEVYDEIDLDLGYATLEKSDLRLLDRFEYVPFYWFLNKGYYYLNREGRFFDNDDDPNINGALTIRKQKVRCIKRRVYYPYQFVTAKIMQKIMIDNFGEKILNKNSEFCQQINNLDNWEIDKDGEHLDGIFTLSDYADCIIQWLPFRDNEKYWIKKAQLQRSNIFDPKEIEHDISEATMKYIYNNYIHNSLVNSADLSKGEPDMQQRQKNGFYIAYHPNLRNTEPYKNDDHRDFDLIDQFPYIDQSKIPCKESGTRQYALEIPQKKLEIIVKFDRFILGADYNKFICPEYDRGNVDHIYGYLQEKFDTIGNTTNYNNKDQLWSFDQDVIRFCPIERVEIIRDRPFLLDSKWPYIFHTTSTEEI